MTSRERILRSLEFRRPDRAPRDLWALPWVELHAAAARDKVLEEFSGDFTRPPGVLAPGDRAHGERNRVGTYTDEWGCVWRCAQDGVVGEVVGPPVAEWSALRTYQPPWEVIENADWDAADCAREANCRSDETFLLAGTGIRPFERMQFLRGSENLLADLAWRPPELELLREMVHEHEMRELDGWVRTNVDAISFMDDWGTQQSLLISPATWRELFKPMYRRYVDRIHAAGKKAFFHSDGHVLAIYEDLIELGVDAVNSQLFCMDIEEIARRFKGRITFWGEIDRQRILPHGTVDEVRAAVGRVRRALDDGAGGVIAQCEWGAANPSENNRAVFEAWNAPIEDLP